jgi:hypothetical protein
MACCKSKAFVGKKEKKNEENNFFLKKLEIFWQYWFHGGLTNTYWAGWGEKGRFLRHFHEGCYVLSYFSPHTKKWGRGHQPAGHIHASGASLSAAAIAV